MLSIILQIIAAALIVDLATGIYHYATDRGWNFRHQVDLFELHHRTNSMDGFDWQPSVAAVPVLAAGVWFASTFWIAAGVFGILAQAPHYWAHQGSHLPFVGWLQRIGLIISPAHHALHHNGRFDSHYCIFTGWNNWWLNQLLPRPTES